MTNAEIKPCPFCGTSNQSYQEVNGPHPTSYVICECDADGPYRNTLDDAIDAWNTRIPDTFALQKENEDLRHDLERSMRASHEFLAEVEELRGQVKLLREATLGAMRAIGEVVRQDYSTKSMIDHLVDCHAAVKKCDEALQATAPKDE